MLEIFSMVSAIKIFNLLYCDSHESMTSACLGIIRTVKFQPVSLIICCTWRTQKEENCRNQKKMKWRNRHSPVYSAKMTQ